VDTLDNGHGRKGGHGEYCGDIGHGGQSGYGGHCG
jgi:hypothetical protein